MYFAVIFLIFTAVLIVKNLWQGQDLIKPQAFFDKRPTLESTVQKAFEGAQGIYAVYIKNFKTGEIYSKDSELEFQTGSLYKLWIMAATFKEIQVGNLKEDEELSEDVETLNNIFNIVPNAQELAEGTITLTTKDAISQMITISHNYAALLLTEKIKLSKVASYLRENGLDKSAVGTGGDSPVSTASDIALFFEKLYRGELVNKELSQKMIDLLRNQKLNDGLPKYLPDKSKVANKTGDIGWFKHDGGVVFTDKGDWVIVILSESDYPAGAQERIALVSKAVYDYFSGK